MLKHTWDKKWTIALFVLLILFSFIPCCVNNNNNNNNKNNPPVAIAGGDRIYKSYLDPDNDGISGEAITLDASNSYDDDGEIINYTWQFNNDVFMYGKVLENLHFSKDKVTTNVKLIVTDNDGSQDSDIINVTTVICRKIALQITNVCLEVEYDIEYSIDNKTPIKAGILKVLDDYLELRPAPGYYEDNAQHKLEICVNNSVEGEFDFVLKGINETPMVIIITLANEEIKFTLK